MEQEATLRVLINHIDYTVAPPGALDNTFLPQVPVIRIYGASSTGTKACVHVHQVFPYFFVEYEGKLNPENGMWIQFQDVFVLTPVSEPVHRKVISFFEPCYCHLDEAQSTFAQITVCPGCTSRERSSLLWIPLVIYAVLEDSYRRPHICQSCCYYIAVWNCYANTLSRLRKPLELHPTVHVRFWAIWMWLDQSRGSLAART